MDDNAAQDEPWYRVLRDAVPSRSCDPSRPPPLMCARTSKPDANLGVRATHHVALTPPIFTPTTTHTTAREPLRSGAESSGDSAHHASSSLGDDHHHHRPLVHPVVSVLLDRRRDETSTPGHRGDPHRVGLVIEGGGMRGVISAGALREMLHLGLTPRCFDAVYGSSAGAMNATYYIAGQPEGVDAYVEDLCDGNFLSLRRLVPFITLPKRSSKRVVAKDGVLAATSSKMETSSKKKKMKKKADKQSSSPPPPSPSSRRPAMDVHYLVHHVMGGNTGKPLNWSAVLSSPTPLKVIATSLDTLTSVTLDDFTDVVDLQQCLLASAAVPTFAGPDPVTHRGQRLVDAAVLEPVPVHAAVADGCTHILTLLTRKLPPATAVSTRVVAQHSSSIVMPGDALALPVRDEPTPASNTVTSPGWRVGMVARWRWRKSPSPSAAQGETPAGATGEDVDTDTNKDSNAAAAAAVDSPSSPPYPLLVRVVRAALFTPPHMKGAWAAHDALHASLRSNNAKDLDEALRVARDDPIRGAEYFSRAWVLPVSSVGPDVGSLCRDPVVLRRGETAGRDALRAAFQNDAVSSP